MNKFLITGNMCGDVEVRAAGDKVVGNFTVAVKRKFNRDKTDFFRCTAWEKTCESIEKWFKKGDMINVIGRVEIDQAEKDGVNVNYTNVIVEEWNFCGGKKESTESNVNDMEEVQQEGESDLPF